MPGEENSIIEEKDHWYMVEDAVSKKGNTWSYIQ